MTPFQINIYMKIMDYLPSVNHGFLFQEWPIASKRNWRKSISGTWWNPHRSPSTILCFRKPSPNPPASNSTLRVGLQYLIPQNIAKLHEIFPWELVHNMTWLLKSLQKKHIVAKTSTFSWLNPVETTIFCWVYPHISFWWVKPLCCKLLWPVPCTTYIIRATCCGSTICL